MRLKIILTVLLSVLLTTAIFAQKPKTESVKPSPVRTENAKPLNFSGIWTLDVKKTKLKEDSFVKGMTMSVLQTAGEIKIDTETNFFVIKEKTSGDTRGTSKLENSPARTNIGIKYSLDGKETEYREPDGIGSAKLTAVIENNKQLNLTQTRRFPMATGEKTLKTYEIWTLSEDGKTLNIWRSTDKIKGDFLEKTVVPEITELVFTKQ